MPDAKTLNQRDAKLVKWLGEAHAKEAELEADLATHISLTEKAAYKKRLQAHLKETREHKRRVAAQIKKLGGPTGQGLLNLTGTVGEVAGKTVAAVKGQVGVARALVTEQAETHLRNAQDELREEHTEIASRPARPSAARPRAHAVPRPPAPRASAPPPRAADRRGQRRPGWTRVQPGRPARV